MSTQQSPDPFPPAGPVATEPRVPLYTEEYAADPHRAFREMRERFGSLVPVELHPGVPATLVVDYHTAVRILNDPDHFPADPRAWQKGIPDECPIKPMLEHRQNALRSSGAAHARYRQANVDAIGAIDLHKLHSTVESLAVPLINSFCASGSADVNGQYTVPLVFQVVNTLLGAPPEIGKRVGDAVAALFDGMDADTVNIRIVEALSELTELKRREPGDDIATRIVNHPTRLDDMEIIQQVLTLYGAGTEPLSNLITNTMLLMLSDERFAGDFLGGSLSTRDALDEVLFADPPMANYCTTYPPQPILIDDVWLPAHQPVVISMTACNNDPAIASASRAHNRSHLSWSIGPHACPAQSAAYLIAQDAIDQILDALPEMRLAVPYGELVWRPGPFHRALAALPVTFPPSPPLPVA